MTSHSSSVRIEYGATIKTLSRFGALDLRYAISDQTESIIIKAASENRVAAVPVRVRIQSSCVFSESLGAIDCDCADQLNAAIEIVVAEGGYIIYFFEEGRGAGLRAKFDAIRLQQQEDHNTATAFQTLGLPVDLRGYSSAAVIIDDLVGRAPVELLTNDPRKVEILREKGINVVSQRSLVVPRTIEAKNYLIEKVRVLGHVIPETELRSFE